MELIKRGTARRLCMRLALTQVPIALIATPDGEHHKLVVGGSRLRNFYADDAGHAVAGPAVTVSYGMIDDRRSNG